MAKIQVHGGDFLFPQTATWGSWTGFTFRKPGLLGFKETLPLSSLDHLEPASEDSVRRLDDGRGWGVNEAALFGPTGLLKAMTIDGTTVPFVARFSDGRRLLGTTDRKTFASLQQAATPRMLQQRNAAGVATAPKPRRVGRILIGGAAALGLLLFLAGRDRPAGQGDSAASTPSPARAAAFDPDALRRPDEVCRALAAIGFRSEQGWGPSNSTPGAYVCRPLGVMVQVGTARQGMPTNVNLYVYGGGARKLDRATLKLNANVTETAPEAKRLLIEASRLLARVLEFPLPENFEEVITREPVRILRNAGAQNDVTRLRTTHEKLVLEVIVQQSRVTSILVNFRNVRESGLW